MAAFHMSSSIAVTIHSDVIARNQKQNASVPNAPNVAMLRKSSKQLAHPRPKPWSTWQRMQRNSVPANLPAWGKNKGWQTRIQNDVNHLQCWQNKEKEWKGLAIIRTQTKSNIDHFASSPNPAIQFYSAKRSETNPNTPQEKTCLQPKNCAYLCHRIDKHSHRQRNLGKNNCKTVGSESALQFHCVLCPLPKSIHSTATATFHHTGHVRFKTGFGTFCFTMLQYFNRTFHPNVPRFDRCRFRIMQLKLALQNSSFVVAPLVHGHVGPKAKPSRALHIFFPPPWALGLQQCRLGGMWLESQIWTWEGRTPTNMQTTRGTSGTRMTRGEIWVCRRREIWQCWEPANQLSTIIANCKERDHRTTRPALGRSNHHFCDVAPWPQPRSWYALEMSVSNGTARVMSFWFSS